MILKDILGLINCEFNLYIRGIKLINNYGEIIPRDLANCKIEKIEFTDALDIYLLEC